MLFTHVDLGFEGLGYTIYTFYIAIYFCPSLSLLAVTCEQICNIYTCEQTHSCLWTELVKTSLMNLFLFLGDGIVLFLLFSIPHLRDVHFSELCHLYLFEKY